MPAPSTNSITPALALGGDALVTGEQPQVVSAEAYREAKATLDEQVRKLKEDLLRRSEKVREVFEGLSAEFGIPGVFALCLTKLVYVTMPLKRVF